MRFFTFFQDQTLTNNQNKQLAWEMVGAAAQDRGRKWRNGTGWEVWIVLETEARPVYLSFDSLIYIWQTSMRLQACKWVLTGLRIFGLLAVFGDSMESFTKARLCDHFPAWSDCPSARSDAWQAILAFK